MIISSLPCLHTFWHAIPTSFYIFNVFLSLVIYMNQVALSAVCRLALSVQSILVSSYLSFSS